ncbi:response regulator [Clostridium brassicae]|uniref:Stage 0 sporulation protein A homolog n=1 Tax=Clostridium brassicae TaxID=2999072 RepID=A0ABT4DCK1_9CLOT|nr:response regulator [Clostridium brassicae]MCY6960041.1 response regulator [Clostridium brassicae]
MLDMNKTFLEYEVEDEEKNMQLNSNVNSNKTYNKENSLYSQIHLGLGLSELVDNINNIGVFILDNSYKYIMANGSHKIFMKKLLGIDIKEGMNILDIFDKFYNNRTKEKVLNNIKEYMNFVLKGNKINRTEEMLIEDDIIQYFDVEVVPIKNNKGEVTRVGVYFLNITENVNMHKLLLKMKMDINSENSDKLDFFKNIKHEIEVPISNIEKSIDNLLQSQLNKKQIEQMNIIRSSTNHLVQTIDNILDMGATKSGKFSGNINSSRKKKNESISKKTLILSQDKEEKEYKQIKHNVKSLRCNSDKEIKILVAEDNLVNQMVIGELIKMRGWNRQIVNNGKEAIEALKKEKYDLILMDISMPIMDGIEATKLIKTKKQWKNIPIIALTAYALVQDKDKFSKLGMDDYLLKPLDDKKLESIVSKHLNVTNRYLNKEDNYFDTKEYDEGFIRLEKILDGNHELVVDLGEKIINMLSRNELNNIIHLVENNDISQLRSELHRIKGAVSNFKLVKIQEILNKIKERSICGDIKEIYKLIDEIEKNMEIFEERLTIYKYKCG